MPRLLRMGLIVLGGGIALVVLVLGIAFAFVPREWIDQEAKRQAAGMKGAAISWKELRPGFQGFAVGIRVSGLAVRVPRPSEGDPKLDLRAKEVFVRFKLLPLLFRRVEIDAARVTDAGIATWDRGPEAREAKGQSGLGGNLALSLPKLELDGIDVRTRDLYGSGVDLRGIHGTAEIDGTLQAPKSVHVAATVDSLFWKGSARDPLLALPSPLGADVTMKGSGGAMPRLDVTHGVLSLGPLKSAVTGSILLPPAPDPARFDLAIVGAPQEIRSTDPAFRALSAKSPAAWSTTASWNVKLAGTAEAPVQSGTVKLAPVQVESGANKFALDAVRMAWNVTPDRHFTAKGDGGGSGLALRLEAAGSTEPGGASNGSFQLDAPAARMNGLAPNTPTWSSGSLSVHATFASRAPNPPDLHWSLTGRDLSGTAPGVRQPIKRLQFAMSGDTVHVDVTSIEATVGSTTGKVTGTVTMGKPLGSGAFRATIDRFISEEWTPPPVKGGAKPAGGKGAAAPPPPLPFRLLTADVAIGEIRQKGMTLRDVTVPVRYENGTLTMAPIRGTMGTGSITGDVALHDFATKPSYSVKLDVQKAPVEEFARGMIPFKLGLSGLLSGNVDLSGPGFPGPDVSDSLRGSMTGTVEQGKIQQNESIQRIRTALGLGGGTDLAFKTLSHVLRIERGRLLLDKVKGDLGADKFELTGALGLDKAMNLGLLLRLAPDRLKGNGTLAQFARYARDSEGRLPIELGIGGTTDKPKVQIKAGKLLDVASGVLKENLSQSLTKSLTQKLATTGGGDSLRGRTDSTATHADSAKAEDPLKKGREALRRLLGK